MKMKMKTIKYNMIIILSLLLMSISALAENTQNTIKVTGFATLAVDTTQGHISTSVVTLAMTVEEALRENNFIMNSLIAGLNSSIYDISFKTSHFSISSDYTQNGNSSVFNGFSIRNSLAVTVGYNNSSFISILEVVGSLVDAGATHIDSVRFSTENTEEIQSQIIVAATADAYKKATIMAQASGVSLGPVVSITSSAANDSMMNPETKYFPGMARIVLSPGSNDISATVTIEYLIK